MTGSRSLTRAWFDLARAGNFPSVWSNVLAALVLSTTAVEAWPQLGIWFLATLAGSLAYAGGTTLNDVADVEFDTRRKPERPIPSHVVSRRLAAGVGVLELLGGIILLAAAGASLGWGVALGTVIVAYDWLHKRWSGSVVLMAGCRVLLGLTVATLPGHAWTPALLVWVGALFVYIAGLTGLARREYAPGAPAAKIGPMIGRLLAFIPLIDAVVLVATGHFWPALACALAVPLGKLAQRIAAST